MTLSHTRVEHPESDAGHGLMLWERFEESSELRLPARPPVATSSEDVSSCVGDSAWPLFSGDKLDVTCLTLVK